MAGSSTYSIISSYDTSSDFAPAFRFFGVIGLPFSSSYTISSITTSDFPDEVGTGVGLLVVRFGGFGASEDVVFDSEGVTTFGCASVVMVVKVIVVAMLVVVVGACVLVMTFSFVGVSVVVVVGDDVVVLGGVVVVSWDKIS